MGVRISPARTPGSGSHGCQSKGANISRVVDEDKTVARHRKRHNRENNYFIKHSGTSPDNNPVKRIIKPVACIRSDGG